MLLKELITASDVSTNTLNQITKNINNYAPKDIYVNIFVVKDTNLEVYVLELLKNPLNIGKQMAKFGKLSVCVCSDLVNHHFVNKILRSLKKEFENLKKGDSK